MGHDLISRLLQHNWPWVSYCQLQSILVSPKLSLIVLNAFPLKVLPRAFSLCEQQLLLILYTVRIKSTRNWKVVSVPHSSHCLMHALFGPEDEAVHSRFQQTSIRLHCNKFEKKPSSFLYPLLHFGFRN
jgi:hypothetical protein